MADIVGSVKAIIVDKLGVDENEVTMELFRHSRINYGI